MKAIILKKLIISDIWRIVETLFSILKFYFVFCVRARYFHFHTYLFNHKYMITDVDPFTYTSILLIIIFWSVYGSVNITVTEELIKFQSLLLTYIKLFHHECWERRLKGFVKRGRIKIHCKSSNK